MPILRIGIFNYELKVAKFFFGVQNRAADKKRVFLGANFLLIFHNSKRVFSMQTENLKLTKNLVLHGEKKNTCG